MPRQQLLHQESLASESLKVAGLLGDNWSVRVVCALAHERMRFSQLQHGLGMSSKTLSKRLKELERNAIVTRTLYAQVPLRVEYELTEKGYELHNLLGDIAKWHQKWQ